MSSVRLPFPRRRSVGHPRTAGGYDTACRAPEVQIHFKPSGDVLACCWSLRPLGNIRRQRLPEIWDGRSRKALVAALRRGDHSLGCQQCELEVSVEGREGSHPA